MLVIGLTGGIGSGKTTVANLFADFCVPIIDADIIARTITQPGEPAFLSIVEHFKQPLLKSDGTLNRKRLREIVFQNDEERKWLENLLHPIIRKEIDQKLSALNTPYCIVVIPLLLETGAYPFLSRILVVDTPEHLQVSRVAARDKAEQNHIAAIIKAQAQRDHRLAKADDIIVNDGKVEDLIPQIERLHQIYLQMAKSS